VLIAKNTKLGHVGYKGSFSILNPERNLANKQINTRKNTQKRALLLIISFFALVSE
jgi:hypothetical protein